MSKITVAVFCLFAFLLSACATPTWIHAPVATDYYATGEPIPLTVGVLIDEPPFSAQWWSKSKTRQDYGPAIVDYLRRMKVFKKIIYPYGKDDGIDAVLSLTIRGKWKYDNNGRAFANFMIGTPNYNDFEGAHEATAYLRIGQEEIANYPIKVTTQGQYSGSDADMIVRDLNNIQIKKLAVEIATAFGNGKTQIEDRLNKMKKPNVSDAALAPSKSAVQQVEKLDKLRDSGIISEEEYKRARAKAEPQPNAETSKKLDELGDLYKSGLLSQEDYNKAKKRLEGLEKLDGLRQSNVLSEEEYQKAKVRLMEKQ